MYVPIEYPKSLYLQGDPESEHVIVQDRFGEDHWRLLGYRMAGESVQEKAIKRKPGRPRKEQ